ncbi:SDR family NAD(P)-dependent oxidoreductase [Modestobacter sp. I12A-02628]|uniref:SDR family oxidoreductase n=1 Tax=Goekera deserti TaxID=2497753 RepID=A0A7K3WFF4_9ACTN|nr:SDR family oxidoreductase [Goekera deserti]MPR00007.1 SDR family NAD(P)-dependent oxidoreductase [Goekera deserti]NDI49785.1 SDR family NAD(P)-dependent oxidoreductase [Goekera deserti]NEL55147.1 SDR family oxidoreductase [Goekera deserti]
MSTPEDDTGRDETTTGELTGRVALVTGGASGLGRAVGLMLAVAGAHVVLGDVDTAGAQRTAAEVAEAGGSAEAVELDVTDDEARRRVTAGLFDRFGDRFDLLVNVAGIDRPGYATDIDLADYRTVHAVNCEGPVFLTSEFLKRAQHRPAGSMSDVVQVTSLSAVTSGSGAIAYNSSKAAFRSATRCIQRELREKATVTSDGVEVPFPARVHSIVPAAMDTPMMHRWGIPAHRMMPPADVARMVLVMVTSPPSSYVPEMTIVPRNEPDFPR